jgi:hypothetical protein
MGDIFKVKVLFLITLCIWEIVKRAYSHVCVCVPGVQWLSCFHSTLDDTASCRAWPVSSCIILRYVVNNRCVLLWGQDIHRSKMGTDSSTDNLLSAELWLGQVWLMPVPPGNMQQTLTCRICSAYKTEYFALLENLTGAHQFTNCTWLANSSCIWFCRARRSHI